MIIAFDYDGVSTDKSIQQLIKKLIKERNEIWVVTMRRENEFNKKVIKPFLESVGLSNISVIYCNEKPKMEMLQMINADIYIDNIADEFENISNYSNTIPLLFKN